MLIYLGIMAAAVTLFWVIDGDQRRRMSAYAVALGGGTAIGFLLFASYANRLPICDALSPVWFSDAVLGGALLFGAALLSPADWKHRLALAAGAGIAVVAFHGLAWPQCLSRPEGVSQEVVDLWLSHVREARPIYRHGWRTVLAIVSLPLTGLIGWLLLVWFNRRDPDKLRRTLAATAPLAAAMLLLLWQTRTGPAAQMLSATGATALLWISVPWVQKSRNAVLRTFGTAALVVLGMGAAVPFASNFFPKEKKTPAMRAVDKANRQCASLWGLKPVAQQPKGMVFTFVDLGPRLITVTHHSAVAGPYHRNGEQIADVMKAFRGNEAQARAIIAKYRSDYVLICPEHVDGDHLQGRSAEGILRPADEGTRARLADAGAAAEELAIQDVAGPALALERPHGREGLRHMLAPLEVRVDEERSGPCDRSRRTSGRSAPASASARRRRI